MSHITCTEIFFRSEKIKFRSYVSIAFSAVKTKTQSASKIHIKSFVYQFNLLTLYISFRLSFKFLTLPN